MDEYFQQQQSGAGAFAFDDLRQSLESFRQAPVAPAGPINSPWAAEFQSLPPQERAPIDPAFWPAGPEFNTAEFAQFQHQAQMQDNRIATPVAAGGAPKQFYRPQQFQGYQNFGNVGMRFQNHSPMQMHTPPVHQQQQQQQPQGKGKERMVELDNQDWAKQFEELEKSGELDEETMNKTIDAELQQQGDNGMFEDFQSVWEGIEQDQLANGITDVNPEWISEFDSQQAWSSDLSHTKSMPNSGDYLFERDNPYLSLDDPFLEGKRLMETGGNLSLAALAFEAAVQKKEDHVEAWTMLGSCQAQNEKETPAIRALETALRQDPQNLNAMMVGLAFWVRYIRSRMLTAVRALLFPTPMKDMTQLLTLSSRDGSPQSTPSSLRIFLQPLLSIANHSTNA